MVRKCFSVPAPREDTYHGAQEGTTNQPTDETNDVFLKLSGELRIATFNCKGANHISAREENSAYDENSQVRHSFSTRNAYQHEYGRNT